MLIMCWEEISYEMQIKISTFPWVHFLNEYIYVFFINPFQANVPFLYPLKTSENRPEMG